MKLCEPNKEVSLYFFNIISNLEIPNFFSATVDI